MQVTQESRAFITCLYKKYRSFRPGRTKYLFNLASFQIHDNQKCTRYACMPTQTENDHWQLLIESALHSYIITCTRRLRPNLLYTSVKTIQPAFLVIPCSNLEHVHRNTWKILTRKAVSFETVSMVWDEFLLSYSRNSVVLMFPNAL